MKLVISTVVEDASRDSVPLLQMLSHEKNDHD